MSSLLEAANVEQNKIEVTDQLPIRVGDVSIMTIREAFMALENSNSASCWDSHYDPTPGYDTSTYYVYGIVGKDGKDSTIENLQAVGLDWYRQFNKSITTDFKAIDLDWYKQHSMPIAIAQTLTSNGKTIFGGPLSDIYYNGNLKYFFSWYHNTNCDCSSLHSEFWGDDAILSVYVAVVRAHK